MSRLKFLLYALPCAVASPALAQFESADDDGIHGFMAVGNGAAQQAWGRRSGSK